MTVQRSRFQRPTILRGRRSSKQLVGIPNFAGGVNYQVPYNQLQPNEALFTQNYSLQWGDGAIRPRPGLKAYHAVASSSESFWNENISTSSTSMVLGAISFRANTVLRTQIMWSRDSDNSNFVSEIAANKLITEAVSTWAYGLGPGNDILYGVQASPKALDFVESTGTVHLDSVVWLPKSGSDGDTGNSGYSVVTADPNTTQSPPLIVFGTSASTLLPQVWSLCSAPASLTPFDERLVFWGHRDTNNQQINRLSWSVKGNHQDYTSIGAGFLDIPEMRGNPVEIINDRDRAVIFSTQEIWEVRATNDAFSFVASPINTLMGVPHFAWRSVVQTRLGPIFYGTDDNIYLLRGADLLSIGDKVRSVLVENQAFSSWGSIRGEYDPDRDHYRLWHARGDRANMFHVFVIQLDSVETDDPVWTEWKTEVKAPHGDYAGICWDQPSSIQWTFAQYEDTYPLDDYNITAASATTSTSAMSCEWVGPILTLSPDAYKWPQEVWMDIASRNSSAVSLQLHDAAEWHPETVGIGRQVVADGAIAFPRDTSLASGTAQFPSTVQLYLTPNRSNLSGTPPGTMRHPAYNIRIQQLGSDNKNINQTSVHALRLGFKQFTGRMPPPRTLPVR